MKYVKQFSINGVDTKQVACIELNGAPNAATEGSVGVLGMDMTSPTHEVYRCVAVNGSVYTWELLSAGMSIMSAIITGEGALEQSFPYDKLRIPRGYIVKLNDLILDSEGYLYQIISIGNDSCVASYCGTHIGGIASGDKDYTLEIKNGRLCLVTESGKVLSAVNYITSDNVTLYQNPSTGVASVLGVKTISGSVLHFFVGTRAEYEALTDTQKNDLFAIITDDDAVKLTRDENGVLKIGDIIIPQRKILVDDPITINANETVVYEDSESLDGRIFEVCINDKFFKFKVDLEEMWDLETFFSASFVLTLSHYDMSSGTTKYAYAEVCFTAKSRTPKQLKAYTKRYSNGTENTTYVSRDIKEIWEIIE